MGYFFHFSGFVGENICILNLIVLDVNGSPFLPAQIAVELLRIVYCAWDYTWDV